MNAPDLGFLGAIEIIVIALAISIFAAILFCVLVMWFFLIFTPHWLMYQMHKSWTDMRAAR